MHSATVTTDSVLDVSRTFSQADFSVFTEIEKRRRKGWREEQNKEKGKRGRRGEGWGEKGITMGGDGYVSWLHCNYFIHYTYNKHHAVYLKYTEHLQK